MELNISIAISGYSSYVDDQTLKSHLEEIANDITNHAKFCSCESYYRKVNVNYEDQEDVHLEISVENKGETH